MVRHYDLLASLVVIAWCCFTDVQSFSAGEPSRHNTFVQRVNQRTQQPIPENNPTANEESVSPVSGVRYADVFQGISQLYPATELDARNAQSRKDGYWPFINQGKDPPECFTYGEFDFHFFAELLDRAHALWKSQSIHATEKTLIDWTDRVFVDIGSGAGRLVVAAAALHPTWKVCRGIELLPGMHEAAQQLMEKHCVTIKEEEEDEESDPTDLLLAEQNSGGLEPDAHGIAEVQAIEISTDGLAEETEQRNSPIQAVSFGLPIAADKFLPMAPVEFVCGSFADPYVHFGNADLIFMFSSALNPDQLTELSCAIGRQCRPGTLVITTDYTLDLQGCVPRIPGDDRFASGDFRFEIVDTIDGWCWCTGGQITAYLHRLVQSVHPDGIPHPLDRPVPTIQDICYEVAMLRERGALTDSNRFLRNVANHVRFQGLPEVLVPRSYR